MFGKLLKHEFKSVGKWYFGLYGLSLIISILLGLWIRTIEARTEFSTDSEAILLGVSISAYAIIMISVAISTFFLVVNRFRKNVYGRQGYLTMTLPVTSHQIILSKLASALVWYFFATIVVLLSILLTISVSGVDEFYSYIQNIDFTVYEKEIIQFFFYQSLETITSILLVYLSISIGQLFKDYRILMAIVAYFIINFVVGSFMAVFHFTSLTFLSYSSQTLLPNPIIIIVNILLGIAYYFGTHYILTKKLNLQ